MSKTLSLPVDGAAVVTNRGSLDIFGRGYSGSVVWGLKAADGSASGIATITGSISQLSISGLSVGQAVITATGNGGTVEAGQLVIVPQVLGSVDLDFDGATISAQVVDPAPAALGLTADPAPTA